MRRSGDYVDSGEGWARPAGRGKAFVWLIRRGASLAGGTFTEARFAEADLTDANLRGANLRSADFRGAKLDGLDWGGADVTDALFDPGTGPLSS
jgi:uncharacterized protein YjbI with pentapeptide repeats